MTRDETTYSNPAEALDAAEDAKLRWPIERAFARCLDAHEVAVRLTCSYLDGQMLRNMLIDHLADLLETDDSPLNEVQELVRRFLAMSEGELTHQQRQSLDATISRLIRLLPEQDQMNLAPNLLLHKRKARRRVGITIVCTHSDLAPENMKQILLQAYDRWHDPEVLTPISRLAINLSTIAPMLLKGMNHMPGSYSSDHALYEQARVFEWLVQHDLSNAVALASSYPIAFVYGTGRARCKPALPYVMEILMTAWCKRQYLRHERSANLVGWYSQSLGGHLHEYRTSQQCISLSIWTLGRLQAKAQLTEFARANGIDTQITMDLGS